MTFTASAFEQLRQIIGTPRGPRRPDADGQQYTNMSHQEGLLLWRDGPYAGNSKTKPTIAAPNLPPDVISANQHLWVVRIQDVAYAPERCEFGRSLRSGVIKHTNLTGGEPAFSGGELYMIDHSNVVITGCSGRYGPSTREEMEAAAKAFANSGYGVWSMGWDDEADLPAPFIGSEPEWVE